MKYLLDGLLLGLAYVAPIGVQNIFIINSAMTQKMIKALQIAFVVIFFDITLAFACFWGIGSLLAKYRMLKMIVFLIGGMAVVKIGLSLIFGNIKEIKNEETNMPMCKIFLTACLVTWFNPHAIIDGSLLLSPYRVSLNYNSALMFILGVCAASFTWFITLSTVISVFRTQISNRLLLNINRVCGVIIVFYGMRILLGFIQSIL